MKKLSIKKIITNIFYIPWLNLRFYSLALAPPILVMVCIWSMWIAISPADLLLHYFIYLIYFISFAYLAIICHKLMLVSNTAVTDVIRPDLKILLRFFLLMVAVYFTGIIIQFNFLNLYLFIFDQLVYNPGNMAVRNDIEVAQYIAYIPSMYLTSRFCLVFPATALGFTTGLKWSWNATRENHLPVFFVVALFPYTMKLVLYVLYRQNTTVAELALLALLTYLTAVLGVFAVSQTYIELRDIAQKQVQE